jgi:hypothetical protein
VRWAISSATPFRFGVGGEVMAGEGIETTLSDRSCHADAVAALSAAHLAPSCSRRRCGGSTSPATTIRPATVRWRLIERASAVGIETVAHATARGLQRGSRLLGFDALRPICVADRPQDVARFMSLAA